MAQAATELIDTFISQGDMDAAIIAKERIMNVAELPSMIVTKPSTENNNNIFCIGGPLANPYVATYLRDRKVFEPLTFGVLDTAPYLCDYNRALLQDIVHKDSCENGVGIRSIRLNGKERWAENQNFIKNKKNY